MDITNINYITSNIPQIFGSYYGTLCQKDNKVYAIGGKDSNNNDIYTISYYDANENFSIKHQCNARLTYSAYYPGVALVGDYIYIFGGDWMSSYSSYGSRKYVYKYNTVTDTISLLSAQLSPARCGFPTIVYNNKIYLFGGGSSVSMTSTTSCNIFDTTTDTFTGSFSLPGRWFRMSAVRNSTDVYLFGGVDYIPTFLDYNKTIYKFNLLNNSISNDKTIPSDLKVSSSDANFLEDNTIYYLKSNIIGKNNKYNFSYNISTKTFQSYAIQDSNDTGLLFVSYNGNRYVITNTVLYTFYVPSSISVGNLEIKNFYCGSTIGDKIFLGNKSIYSRNVGFTVSVNDIYNFTVYDGQDSSGIYLDHLTTSGASHTSATYTITSGYIYFLYDYGTINSDDTTTTGGVQAVSNVLYRVFADGTISHLYAACMIEGTKITLGDYTVKNIEDITYDDTLLVWDFYEGKLSTAKPLWIKEPEITNKYNLVEFSNGTTIGFVGTDNVGYHRIYNMDANKFTHTGSNDTPNGTHTFCQDNSNPRVINQTIVTNKPVKYYNIITDKHYNLFANGILTSCKISNRYGIKGMKYTNEINMTEEEVNQYIKKAMSRGKKYN